MRPWKWPGSREAGVKSRPAAAWGAGPAASILLSGGQASPEQLNQALAFRPSVVHFATHFLKSAGDDRRR